MDPLFDRHGVRLFHGDCLDVLKTLPDASISAVVTDPPYGISMMGHKWDYDVPAVAVWAECFRVLKPGGHLLSFAGTRTQHRMAVNIEDAGFDIRDMIAWVYGQGFPKSLDVSKAIDKAGPNRDYVAFPEFARHYAERRKAVGMTHAQVCELGRFYGTVNHGGTSVNWERGFCLPTVAQWDVVAPVLSLDEKWKVRVAREEYEREVIGTRKVHRGVAFTSDGPDEVPVTLPGCEQSRQWQGWGTALKPALEPITVARKPLIGTVAENVLDHGTGALNIDGCRINPGELVHGGGNGKANHGGRFAGAGGTTVERPKVESHTAGRFPANLVHDGSEEVVSLFPHTKSGDCPDGFSGEYKAQVYGKYARNEIRPETVYADEGSAARFFYTAKASKSERREGNNHPTVKPIKLCEWLVRLVTPPGGVVLDPFMGSGTTGVASVREGKLFIGIEREAEYMEIAVNRIKRAGQEAASQLPFG